MEFKENVIFREEAQIGNVYEEMMFMSSCKHAIISNSTFHWWGAWLINNINKIVIAPNPWFTDNSQIDIIPNDWIKLER